MTEPTNTISIVGIKDESLNASHIREMIEGINLVNFVMYKSFKRGVAVFLTVQDAITAKEIIETSKICHSVLFNKVCDVLLLLLLLWLLLALCKFDLYTFFIYFYSQQW